MHRTQARTRAVLLSNRAACGLKLEDAARALKRPCAPVIFHGERETESSGGGDVFIENAGTADGARVKILGVVSADCH